MNSNKAMWEYLSVKLYGPDYKCYEYSEFVELPEVWRSQIC